MPSFVHINHCSPATINAEGGRALFLHGRINRGAPLCLLRRSEMLTTGYPLDSPELKEAINAALGIRPRTPLCTIGGRRSMLGEQRRMIAIEHRYSGSTAERKAMRSNATQPALAIVRQPLVFRTRSRSTATTGRWPPVAVKR